MKDNQNNQPNKFATHPIFDIDELDWLNQHLTAQSLQIKDSQPPKGDPNYGAWQERCACIGMMTPPARALCSMLIWGLDKHSYDVVREYLADKLLTELKKTRLPKGCVHDRADLAGRMAHMVLHLHLWNMWDLVTVKGRLYFFSIDINEKTYLNQFVKSQRFLIKELENIVTDIECTISKYKKSLYQINNT